MGGKNVKNTMVEWILEILAPHLCFGCGKIGTMLCEDCKNDIVSEPFLGCFVCGLPHSRGICSRHSSPIDNVFTVGQREGALETLINAVKFSNLRAGTKTLAQLLHERLPLLPQTTQIVPIPTVASHIRSRGYDQVDLIARYVSEYRQLPIVRALTRQTNTTQHTARRLERHQQANTAFSLTPEARQLSNTILIVDDIITTGATVSAAASLLESAMGDEATIWVASLAYQTLQPSTEQ